METGHAKSVSYTVYLRLNLNTHAYYRDIVCVCQKLKTKNEVTYYQYQCLKNDIIITRVVRQQCGTPLLLLLLLLLLQKL